jgi:tyrosinase
MRVQEDITRMYGSSARRMLASSNAQTAGPVMANAFMDWSVAATAMASALPPSFVLRLFLGGNSSSDVVDVGSWVKLMPASHHMNTTAEKHASTIDTTYQGSVSLTASLLDEVTKGRLRTLDPVDVVPHLKENLNWTVVSVRFHLAHCKSW